MSWPENPKATRTLSSEVASPDSRLGDSAGAAPRYVEHSCPSQPQKPPVPDFLQNPQVTSPGTELSL